MRLAARAVVAPVADRCVALSGFERLAFGASRVDGYRHVLEEEDTFPFYQRTSFNSLAKRLGFPVARADGPSAELRGRGLAYPLHPIVFRADAPRLNVIVLCAESLRADALEPEQMPATWARAQRGLRFEHHLSAGNGTRMGVFGLFYGLPGPYWFRFLNARRGPVLLSELHSAATTCAASRPTTSPTPSSTRRYSRTSTPPSCGSSAARRELAARPRDGPGRSSTTSERRDPSSALLPVRVLRVAPCALRLPARDGGLRPYLRSFDYVTMNLERDIEQIRNRYRNSVRHLDTQYERVLARSQRAGC